MESDDKFSVDLLVIGAGMAGMTAAARATSRGATVAVVEKAKQIGGSAVLAAGGVVAPRSLEDFRRLNPGGRAELNRVLVDRYDEVIEWIEGLGVSVVDLSSLSQEGSEASSGVFGQPLRSRIIDVAGYINRCAATLLGRGGWLVTSATVDKLLTSEGMVRGAVVRDRDGLTEIEASWTLLASGGFQNERSLRAEYLGPNGTQALIRSNPFSSGDGLRLGRSAGADVSGAMDRFYGHPIVWPLNHDFTEKDYTRLALSAVASSGVVLNSSGARFFDESLGYWVDSQMILRQPHGRALVVGASGMPEILGSGPDSPFGIHDRVETALKSGGHAVTAQTLEELQDRVAAWGYANVAATVAEFNRQVVAEPDAMSPPRSRNRRPLTGAPFFAIEAQSSVTFTFGGLRIDDRARVLAPDGTPVPGLLAAGADAGGFYCEGYCGGLGMSASMAFQAADNVSHVPAV